MRNPYEYSKKTFLCLTHVRFTISVRLILLVASEFVWHVSDTFLHVSEYNEALYIWGEEKSAFL
jgi:hypothetical protein